ncbi:MAG TPA: DUF2326 domain-containing protein [Archangium sp.]|nr:DUF2326 domain-containing protein [Archangium sp.]
MRLSSLYSNDNKRFEPIQFRPGLNVVLAQIRDPENRKKDTHNLGKTTLSRLIDFCLLKKKSNDFFLFRHKESFKGFVFFLEVHTAHHGLITVRRSVAEPTRIAIMRHSSPNQDFAQTRDEEWSHVDVPFERAKQLLDGLLELRAVSPWTFRNALSYSLRVQKDYQDVFQLDKFRGQHETWKPYLAHLLGFDSKPVQQNYELDKRLEANQLRERQLRSDLIGLAETPDKIEGVLLIKGQEVAQLENQISGYNFMIADQSINKELVDDIEAQIAQLNERRYYLSVNQRKIEVSLQEKVNFDLDKIQKLFEESKVYFSNQLKKDYGDLLRFNKEISEERESYLKEELGEISGELANIEVELGVLDRKRANALSALKEKETFSKYKKLNSRLVEFKADIEDLTRKRNASLELQSKQKQIRELKIEKERIRAEIESNIQAHNDRYRAIRLFFSEIIKRTIDRNAVISTRVNNEGNLEFSAEILNDQGGETSQGSGHTYRKLLCIAFDMALCRAYLEDDYPHFVYHDGILESLDDRKKENLIEELRQYSSYGVQQIVSVIDSDLPVSPQGARFQFQPNEVVRTLHDEGESGRLFRMPIW